MNFLDDTAMTDEQFQRLRRGVTRRIRNRRRGHRVIALGATGAVALAATAGGIIVNPSPAESLDSYFDCHHSLDRQASWGGALAYFPEEAKKGPLTLEARMAKAIDICKTGWAVGEVNSDWKPIAVPNPTVCQLPDRRLSVWPNPQGLSPKDLCWSVALSVPHEG